MGYANIENLYKCQDILLFKMCFASEKIHGTSAHISWNSQEVRFFAGGEKHEKFVAIFDVGKLSPRFVEFLGNDQCVVFGEAYGGKCQGMSETYGKDLKFIAFDVKVGEVWLSMPDAEALVHSLGLEFVYYERIAATIEDIDAAMNADSVQAVRNGMGPGHMREGVVLRPLIELTKNNGSRIVAKHKRDEFAERKHVPKVLDGNKLQVLADAAKIADEWVVPMRLEHVLQEHPEFTVIEHTHQLIKAMVADVYKESKGEIVESKEVSSAIGRRVAGLWKAKVCKL